MGAKRKPFQEKTVEWVVAALRAPGASRRFLVADEVGLGKTLVAQGVIEDLMKRMKRLGRPPCVLYVCSNLTIARQNHEALLDLLPRAQREHARPQDRLALLPRGKLNASSTLQLYSLTPYTSGGRGGGRADERALLAHCLEQVAKQSSVDGRTSSHMLGALRLVVDTDRWKTLRANIQLEDERVVPFFRRRLCAELKCRPTLPRRFTTS